MTDYTMKLKPWWLRLVTRDWQWVTIAPTVYQPGSCLLLPKTRPEYWPIIAHECRHLEQQRKAGLWKWLAGYFLSRRFRLDQEAEAIAVEIGARPFYQRATFVARYAEDLAGGPYWWAAKSYQHARDAILAKCEEMEVEI
jgi:hypothetical protein